MSLAHLVEVTESPDSARMSLARLGHTSTALADGRILVVGGSTTVVDIYTPASADSTFGSWSQGPAASITRSGHSAVAFQSGHKILITGGSTVGGVQTTEVFDMDLNSGQGGWVAGPPTNFYRVGGTGLLLPDGRILLIGGTDGLNSMVTQAEIFDPAANSGAGTITLGPNFLTARVGFSVSLLSNGKVLIAGGSTDLYGQYPLSSCEIFDPSNLSLTYGPTMQRAHVNHTATTFANGTVFIIGSGSQSSYAVATSDTELFDPTQGLSLGSLSWTTKASLTSNHYSHSSVLLQDGRVFVAGGFASGGTVATNQIYDPNLNSWSAGPAFVLSRYSFTATRLRDGSILFAGGRNNSTLGFNSSELLDASATQMSMGADVEFARAGHTLVTLNDGRVFMAGGAKEDQYGALSTYIYNPAGKGGLGLWTRGPDLLTPRINHTATLLLDGRVLLAGGNSLATTEIFDPTANSGRGSVVAGATMSAFRASHSATRLADGRVLLAGGVYMNTLIASCEIFDPGLGGAGTMALTTSMLDARDLHSATLLADGNRVLVVGGQVGTLVRGRIRAGAAATLDLFDAAGSGTWTRLTPVLAIPSSYPQTVILPDGRVLIGEGSSSMTSLQILTESPSNVFTMSTPVALAVARLFPIVSFLVDGRVAIIGGQSAASDLYSSIEIFDPTTNGGTGSVTAVTAALSVPRYSSQSVVLNDGRILMHGGLGNGGAARPETALISAYETAVMTAVGGSSAFKFKSLVGSSNAMVLSDGLSATATLVPQDSGHLSIQATDLTGAASQSLGVDVLP